MKYYVTHVTCLRLPYQDFHLLDVDSFLIYSLVTRNCINIINKPIKLPLYHQNYLEHSKTNFLKDTLKK